MKKLLALLLVVLLVVPALAFAENFEISGEIRVTYWGGDSRIEKTTEVAQMFMEAYPNVTVILEHSSDYWTQLDTQLAAGGAPDVLQFGGNFPDYVANGFLAPITEYLGTIIDTEYFDQSMIDDITVDGEVYGMCLGANRVGMVFNQTLLETYGAPLPDETLTWDNLGDYLAQVKAVLPDGVYPIFDASVYETSYLSYYAGCLGESFWNGTESTMTEETIKAWMQMWADFRDAGYCPPGEISAEYDESSADTSALVAGEIAMVFLYSNMAVGYQAATTDTLNITCLPDREAMANAMLPPIPVPSPCECVLAEWVIPPGAMAQAGQTLATLVAADQPLTVRAEVPLADARKLRIGQIAEVSVPGHEEPVRAQIERIDFRLGGRRPGEPAELGPVETLSVPVIVRPDRPFDFDTLGYAVSVTFL